MTVNPTTGTGTLVLNVSASNPSVGVNGIETFAVQFINASHALITQFDGSATSSGSLDLQTATSGAGGNFAFTLSGLDTTGIPGCVWRRVLEHQRHHPRHVRRK